MSMQKVYRIVDYLMDRVQSWSVLDVGIFKTCLFTLGILLGTCFHKFFRKIAPLIWVCVIASYVALIYKLLIAPVLYPQED